MSKQTPRVRRSLGWLFLILVLAAAAAGTMTLLRPRAQEAQARVVSVTPAPVQGDFARVEGPTPFVFPRDHGPKPEFQTEWWYYTGNLQSEDGSRYGYQLTFFRRSVTPLAGWPERASDWATNQVYMAHFTLTDVSGQRFRYYERFERGAAGLAGALGAPAFSVWLRDWRVEQTGTDRYRLSAKEGDISLVLDMLDTKGPIPQGDQGYSRKGPQPGNASLYYSQTRLQSEGVLRIGATERAVSGFSWMDREISTSALSKGQVGWDWFALQMDDGTEMMVYILRREDGSVDTFSKGSFIRADGSKVALSNEAFQIEPRGTWRSPHSGGVYPAAWEIRVPSLDLTLSVTPQLADQELNVSFTYWEGSVTVSGERAGALIEGFGYVELTGYAESLEGEL